MVSIRSHIGGLFRLIRWQNLLIIAAVQVLLHRCIFVPLITASGMAAQLSAGSMILLVLATVCIAAGGYAINDYFDRKIDMINKPEKIIIGKLIHTRHVMAWHLVFTIAGILLGTWVSLRSGLLFLSLVFIMVSGLLWFYSTAYKKQLLLGTFIVALLTALVPFMVWLFEMPLLVGEYGSGAAVVSRPLLIWVLGFSVFAFLLNVAREIVKDAEDFEGDRAFGKQTLPVATGIKCTKVVITGILLLVVSLLLLAYLFFIPDTWTIVYFMLFLILPLLLTGGIVLRGNTQKLFHTASIMLKFIMLSGILYMVLANYIINRLL
ncbi:MAG: geranylgeranylglycerol-phosphate geranylgeranyltransferase [Bacteroidales bacterium]|nr:geranylgeranylglycerol-phosphate geranylgeranyltransferase [Bacteroidales bacterium]